MPPFVQQWKLKTTTLNFTANRPAIMGIVNVTPDSFSDGGRHNDTESAVAHALQLVEQGADILDVGGESTRPYSDPVSVEDELQRTIAVVFTIAKETHIPISIDTSKPAVARQAIDSGAQIINDVTGLQDPEMVRVAVESGAGVCAMHMQGTPQTMQDKPQYENVVHEILDYLMPVSYTHLTLPTILLV